MSRSLESRGTPSSLCKVLGVDLQEQRRVSNHGLCHSFFGRKEELEGNSRYHHYIVLSAYGDAMFITLRVSYTNRACTMSS